MSNVESQYYVQNSLLFVKNVTICISNEAMTTDNSVKKKKEKKTTTIKIDFH